MDGSRKFRIGVLGSGKGSNFVAIADACAAGRVPAHVIESCDQIEPRLAGLDLPTVSIAVAGLDVVRDAPL